MLPFNSAKINIRSTFASIFSLSLAHYLSSLILSLVLILSLSFSASLCHFVFCFITKRSIAGLSICLILNRISPFPNPPFGAPPPTSYVVRFKDLAL